MRALVLTKYHFLSLWNWRSVYLGRIIEPAAYLLFLAAGIASVAGASGPSSTDYHRFVLAGLICLLSFRTATAVLSDVSNDRKWGVFALYTMQGGGAGGYLVSILLVYSAVFTVQVVLLAGLGWVLHTAPPGGDLLWLWGVGLLVSAGWVGVGAGVGTRVQSYARRDFLVTITSLPVVLAAPLFYPLDNAPSYLKAIATINPLTYQAGWLRASDSARWPALALAAAWALAAGAVAVLCLRSADRLATER